MLFFTIILGVLFQSTFSRRVQLSTGTIEGKELNATYSSLGVQTGIAFMGIPYVEPPLGDLRFRKPRPPIPWKGVLETKSYKPACLSNMKKTYKNDIGGPISEDCLYLNVFTNRYCLAARNCSVMIIAHGGGFLYESASAFNPEILINNFVGQERNIVTVSVNYRLGIFGFGHFNEEGGEKNSALYDFLEAVKWVRREIKSFGGDKNRITVAGHSAGAGMMYAFSSSPLSKGLVHQQIVMSLPLPNISKKSNYKATFEVAKLVNCFPRKGRIDGISKQRTDKIYNCMRNVSGEKLLEAQLFVLENTTYYIGVSCIDGTFNTDYPEHLYASHSIFPINTMLGTTTAELRDTQYIIEPQNAAIKQDLLNDVCEHAGYELYKEPERFVESCIEHYSNGTNAQFLSDDMEFHSRAVQLANAHSSSKTKVFLYSYAYSGAGKAFNKYLNTPSPHHSEDLIYVFGTHRGEMAPKDYIIERIYSGLFANFVNFGDPSPSKEQRWPQYSPEEREHFLIDFDENFTMPGARDHYYTEAVNFWSNVGAKLFNEHWAPSHDLFITANLLDPIKSHLMQESTDVDKTLEQTEKLYFERRKFLQELKADRKLELEKSGRKIAARSGIEKQGFDMKVGEEEGEEGEGGINILLVIFGGTLLIGILYVSISHFCIHRKSREGYQLLK